MKYYIIAGEASGDLHGSNLIRGLVARDSNAAVRAWGGDLMAAAGAELVHHYKEGAVMGLSDTVAKLGKLLGNIRSCKADILSWRPDVVILIDYPGFNMRIAEFCHRKGIKTFYYIAPKTWASREGRNRKLRKYIDMLFIVFPFEIPYFTKKGIPFIYKGNPLIDAVDGSSYSPDCGKQKTIAIAAGSREGEISRMMPVCMQAADLLHSMSGFEDYTFVIAGAPARKEDDYNSFIGENRPYVKVEFGKTYEIISSASAAIINSGTASLETALLGTPQVVCWSTGRFTAWVALHILKVMDHVKFISLGNLILDKLAFKELIQDEFTAHNVCEEVVRLVQDNAYREGMIKDYAEIRHRLGGSGASQAVAQAMIDELQKGTRC